MDDGAVDPSNTIGQEPRSKYNSNIFDHVSRLPQSPLNCITTPRKPKPPGRQRASTKPQTYFPPKSNRHTDALLLQSYGPQTSDRRARRVSRNLEEEIFEADSHTIEDLAESETLVGTGTRDQTRGFLARGGAGGEPVFMGEGYVQAYESQSHPKPNRKTRRVKR
jgi:hypothetical protein